jgi:hypothetical protein
MLICGFVDLDQVPTLALFTVSSHTRASQRARPLRQSMSLYSCSSSPLDGQRWSRIGIAAVEASAFQGRCFVVVRRGWTRWILRREDVCVPGPFRGRDQSAEDRWQGYAERPSRAGIKPSRHHKAPFCRQGAALTQRSGPVSAPPSKDRPRPPIVIADPALVRRLEQGARESDGQEHANRGNCPSLALGLVQHRRGWQMEKVIPLVTLPQH